jgi:hypothetical protein
MQATDTASREIGGCFVILFQTKKDIINSEGVYKLRVRRFSGLFWPILSFFCGGHINFVYDPHKKSSKSAQKNQKIELNLNL